MKHLLATPLTPYQISALKTYLIQFFSLLLAVGVLSLSLGCKSEDPEQKFTRLTQAAEKFKEEGKLEEARISLQSAIQVKPEDAASYFELGDILAKQKNIAKAVLNYQYTINLDPKHKEARRRIAALYIVAGKTEEAESHVRKLLELDPNDKDSIVLEASLAAHRKDFAEAKRLYQKILTIDENDAGALAGLADLAIAEGDSKKAEEYLKQALAKDPDNGPIQLALINMYSGQGRLKEAEDLLSNMVKTTPENSGLRYFFGEFLLSYGERSRAQVEFEASLKSEPLRHSARDRLFDIHLVNKMPEKSRELVSDLESSYPEEPALAYFKARLLELERKNEEALEKYLSVIGKLRSFAPAFRRTGLMEISLGKTSEGLQHLNQAIAIDPFDVGARIALSRYFFKQEDYGQAQEHVNKVLSKFPRQVAANILRADIARQQGDLAAAERVYRLMVKAFPDNPAGYLRLAALAEDAKKPEVAIELYKKAIEYDKIAYAPAKRLVGLTIDTKGYDAAEEELRALQHKVSNTKADLNVVLATLLLTKPGKNAEARELLQSAIEAKPDFLPAYSLLARLDSSEGKNEEAVENYKKLVERKPKHLQTRLLLALTYERLNKYKEAAEEYRGILKVNSRFGPAANNLAWLLADVLNEDLNKALDLALVAKEELPNESAVADTLGWVYFRRNSARAALPLIEEAVELEREANGGRVNPEILYHLAVVKEAVGDSAGAKAAAQEALKGLNEQHPKFDSIKKLIEKLS